MLPGLMVAWRSRGCGPASQGALLCLLFARDDAAVRMAPNKRARTTSDRTEQSVAKTNRPLKRKTGKNEAALHRGRIIRCRAASRRVLGAALWWSHPGRPFIHQAHARIAVAPFLLFTLQ